MGTKSAVMLIRTETTNGKLDNADQNNEANWENMKPENGNLGKGTREIQNSLKEQLDNSMKLKE
jgi:hypothetical protein